MQDTKNNNASSKMDFNQIMHQSKLTMIKENK